MKKITHYNFSILIFLAVLSLAACNAEPEEANLPSDTQPSSPAPDESSTQSSLPTATEPLPMDTPEPLPTDTAEPLPTDTAEPSPADTAEPLPTDTPVPLPADTPVPLPADTPVPLPTETPVPLPTATNPPPLPTPTVDTFVALKWPEYGEYRNPFLFKWIGSPDETYQVTLRHLDRGFTITSGPILAIDWIVDIPADQFGNWEWYVTNSSGIQSEVWTFVFQPHVGSGSGGDDDVIAPPPRDP